LSLWGRRATSEPATRAAARVVEIDAGSSNQRRIV
jgi:hypothetical protein